MRYALLILILLSVLAGCSTVKYQCASGHIVDDAADCPPFDCPQAECDPVVEPVCEEVTCPDCPVCEEDKVVPVVDDGRGYTFYTEDQVQVHEPTTISGHGDTEVILQQVGVKEVDGALRARIYWKVRNLGPKDITVHPHRDTVILVNGTEFKSKLIGRVPEADDFLIGANTGGEIRPGASAEGGVNVDGLPLGTTSFTVMLPIEPYDDFIFGVTLE